MSRAGEAVPETRKPPASVRLRIRSGASRNPLDRHMSAAARIRSRLRPWRDAAPLAALSTAWCATAVSTALAGNRARAVPGPGGRAAGPVPSLLLNRPGLRSAAPEAVRAQTRNEPERFSRWFDPVPYPAFAAFLAVVVTTLVVQR